MTDEQLEDWQRLAEAEEREQREAERADRAARAAERQERSWAAELDREPDWTRYRSTLEMDSRTFSRWCDSSPRPRLGPPEPTAAAPAKPELQLTTDLIERLGDANGRILTKVIRQERERLAGELAARDLRISELEGRLRAIEAGLIAKALAAEPLALPAPRGNGLAREH